MPKEKLPWESKLLVFKVFSLAANRRRQYLAAVAYGHFAPYRQSRTQSPPGDSFLGLGLHRFAGSYFF